MKKLIAVLTAVAGALGLHAANNIGTSFEGLLPEGVASTNYVDVFSVGGAEIETGKKPGDYWDVSAAVFDEEGFVVKNYDGETKPTSTQRSDYYSTYANTNFLAITTKVGNPVTRYINAEDAGSHAAVTVQNDDSYYFDSSVKFTAFETNKEASVILAGDGKLAIWLQANVDPDTLEPTSTNLIVSAGRLSDDGHGWVSTPTNYVCELRNPEGVDLTDGGWHRVSVKAFGSIYGTDTVPGFSIAIDSKLVRFVGAKGDAGIVENGLTPRVQGLYNTRTLFPSAYLSGDTTAISSVSFDGVGALDDLVFTDENPNIDDWNESGSVIIDAGENVTGYTYTIQGESPVVASGTVNLQYSAVDGKTITISDVDCAPGYVPSGVSTNGTDILEGWEISDIFDMETITVLAKDAGATVDDGSGTLISFETVADAFDKINDGTISPAGTITVTLAQNSAKGVELNADGVSVILDLAGKTLEGLDAGGTATISLQAGSLVITNSTVEIGSVIPEDGYEAVSVGDGDLAIGGGIYEGVVNGENAASFAITDGSFLASAVDSSGTFDVLDAAVKEAFGDDYGLAQVGDYYVVQESITSYDVTFIDPEGGNTVLSRNKGYTLQVGDVPSLAGKVGYDSTGWATNGVTVNPVGIVVTEEITFTAVYTGKSFTIVTYTNGVEVANATTNFTYDSETASAIVPAIDYNSETEEWDGKFYESDGETLFAFDASGELTQYAYATITATGGGLDPEHGTTEAHSSAATPAAAETEVKSNIIVPAGAAAAVSKDDYADYFKYGVSGTAGDYTVSITGIVESVEADVAASAVVRLTDGEATAITVPAGLYYKITPSADLPISGTPATGLSTGTVTIGKPAGTDKGFYKIELNATPISE